MMKNPACLTPVPYETGTTAGGGLLAVPGFFLRRFCKGTKGAGQPVRPPLFADQQWLVVYARPNGDVAVEAVTINGGNLQADIETLARLALHDQRDIDCATILRIQLDLAATPASNDLLARITRDHNARRLFDAECG